VNGPQALRYVLRRLALEGLSDPELDDPELYDYITEGRDYIATELAMCGFMGLAISVLLTEDSTKDPPELYIDTTSNPLPLRVLEIQEAASLTPLDPMATHDDLGNYRFLERGRIQLADGINPEGGVNMVYMPEGVDIDADTLDTDAAWRLPTFCHRAACKYAAYLALTANEETDGKNAEKQFYRDMDRIQRLVSEFDAAGGIAFRKMFLASEGQRSADTLY
jgi:hypothetical protein